MPQGLLLRAEGACWAPSPVAVAGHSSWWAGAVVQVEGGGLSMLPTHRTSLKWEPVGGQAVTRRSKAPLSLKMCQGVTRSPQVRDRRGNHKGQWDVSMCCGKHTCLAGPGGPAARFSCPQ